MNEPDDNSPTSARQAGRRTLIEAGESPAAIATRLAGARRKDGTPRPFVHLVGQRPHAADNQTIARFRGLLERGRFEEAMRLCAKQLTPPLSDEAMRRVAFALLERPAWRRRLMPVLRAELIERTPGPPFSGLYLYGLIQAGRMPEPSLTSPLIWTIGATWLLDHCAPESLLPLVRQIGAAFPDITFIDDFATGISMVPAAVPGDGFRDHWNAEVQMVRSRSGPSRRLLICFTGMFGRMGTPVGVFDRWAAHQATHVLYLKDMRRNFYRRGIRSVGRSQDDLHVFLRTMADKLEVDSITLYGISMGGVPAVEAALALGAQRVIWAAGAIERENRSLPWNDPGERQRRIDGATELLDKLRAHDDPPEIACIYGEDFETDREMPEVLSAHPRVSLHALKGLTSHNVDFHLIKNGNFDRLVAWAVGDAAALDLA